MIQFVVDLLKAVVIGVVGFLALLGVYRAIRDQWPIYYYPVRTTAQALVRQSLGIYALFRFIPVFMVALFVTVTTGRVVGSGSMLALMTCLLLYLGVSLAELIKSRPKFRINLIFAYAFSYALTLFAGVVAYYSQEVLSWSIPQPMDMVNAVWTAAIAAIAYFALTQVLSGNERTTDHLFLRAKYDVQSVWDYCAEAARTHQCDVEVLRAIILAEAVQRPSWLRWVEFQLQRLFGKFGRKSTTGVAQINSVKPLTDKESIDLLAERLGRCPHNDAQELRGFLRRHHNNDETLINDAHAFYDRLTESKDVT